MSSACFGFASKRVYLVSSPAFLDECLSGRSKLADSAGFKAARAGLPGEGNGLTYASAELSKALRGMIKGVTDASAGRPGARETAIFCLMTLLLPGEDHAQAKVTVNREDGILVSSNSTASMKEGILMSGASFMAAFAGWSFRTVSQGSFYSSSPAIESHEIPVALEPEEAEEVSLPVPEE